MNLPHPSDYYEIKNYKSEDYGMLPKEFLFTLNVFAEYLNEEPDKILAQIKKIEVKLRHAIWIFFSFILNYLYNNILKWNKKLKISMKKWFLWNEINLVLI